MRLLFSSSALQLPKSSPLLHHAIEGDLVAIKVLVGQYIASYEYSEALTTKHDRFLQRYVDLTDKEGNTPLIGAAFKDRIEIAKFLLEKCGANHKIKNNMGCSALWIAAGYSNISCLKILIEFGLKVETTAEKKLEFIIDKNKNGDSPFLAAASKDHTDVVKILFQAIQKCSVEEKVVIQQQWELLCSKNNSGDTAISVCCSMGFKDLLHELLGMEERCIRSGVIKGIQGERPLNASNRKGLSPLMIACERNHQSIVEELIKHDASVVGDSKERSPLAIASFCGCYDVAKYLLSLKTFKHLLNQKDVNSCTPLWLAARTGNLKMVKLLLDAGADVLIIGSGGLSVFQVAEKFKKDSVIQYFKDANIR